MRGVGQRLAGGVLLTLACAGACGDSSETGSVRVGDDAGSDAQQDSIGGSSADGNGGDAAMPVDASADATASDAGSERDAEVDAEGDITDAGQMDTFSDAAPPFCGDSIRDPANEECDDGTASGDDSCTSDCRVRSLLVVGGSALDGGTVPERALGAGRHVTAAAEAGFGIVYTQGDSNLTVRLQTFDRWGRRSGAPVNVAAGGQPTGAANPVVAALPGDRFAVAWTDGSGGTPDVALRLVTGGSAPSGVPGFANVSRAGSQQDPDIVWTGRELVVGWSDLFSIKYRRFSAALAPAGGEQTLSAGSQLAGNLALAPFAGEWAAAWRANDQGLETVQVRVGDSTWSTHTFLSALEGDHPALLELDSTHLLLFFTTGGERLDASARRGRRLRIGVIDVTTPGAVTSSEFLPATPPYDADGNLRQRRPAAVRVGDRVFVAWESESPLGDPLRSEFFVAEVGWSASEPQVIRRVGEWPAPGDVFRDGDQHSPALGGSPLSPGGALITAWEDHSGLLVGRPSSELMLHFRPVPFVTLGDASP